MIFKYSVIGDILHPNEGRLHKGNPLKKLEKEAKRVGKRIESSVRQGVSDLGDSDWWEQVGSSIVAGIEDPRTLASFGLGLPPEVTGASAAEAAGTAWSEMTEAKKAEVRAQLEAEAARIEEARLLEEQKAAQQEQERMVAEREREAERQAKERAARLGQGRRGLLYAGSETGVSNVLGG